MRSSATPELSLLVPAYNEAASLPRLRDEILAVLKGLKLQDFEIIVCDDGSSDGTAKLVSGWHKKDPRIRLIRFSRNFGKENALTALIAEARGRAMIMLDADGQHPVEAIPEFITEWRNGAQVVVGLHEQYEREGVIKTIGSKIFYSLFNSSTGQRLEPSSSDFRLITQDVRKAFLRLPESDRITRGLIDWLGFDRAYVSYAVKPRLAGSASYSRRKLIGLAANTFVSMSPKPLYIFGYLGVATTIIAGLLGLAVLIEQVILEDPLKWEFTGTAMLGTLILFLVGILLMSQGLLSLYITYMQRQSKQRPLYVIDYAHSAGVNDEE